MCFSEIWNKAQLFDAYQFVYVWQSKFQSIPLCPVDAGTSTLRSGSSLSKDGVHEAETEVQINL